MNKILVLFAHPAFERSTMHKSLLDHIKQLENVAINDLYENASRSELLDFAGAKDASIIIIAIGAAEKRLEVVETVKKHFPHLHMLVRSTNRYDAYNQMNAGLLHIYRETLDTSLRVGVDAMSLLGYRKYTAKHLANTFFKYDEQALKKLSSIRDQEVYINEIIKSTEELELIMQSDNQFTIQSELGEEEE